MPARIRIFSSHAPNCSRIYLPASSRRPRELGATNLGLDLRRGLLFFGDARFRPTETLAIAGHTQPLGERRDKTLPFAAFYQSETPFSLPVSPYIPSGPPA